MDNQPTVFVRQATASDLALCLDINPSFETNQVWQMSYQERKGRVAVSFQTVRLPQSRRIDYPHNHAQLLERWHQSHEFFVLEKRETISSDKPLAGYLSLTMDSVDGIAWIGDLVVDDAYRKQGYGSRLLDTANQWAKKQQATRLMATIQTKNYPAIQFFKKSGFALWGYNEALFYSGDIALHWGMKVQQVAS